ncbi:ABSCISIC ACID-INSENSITIVE 5-like protein 6 [Striga hermonthica]|uniref:ABSCISIC ACID-INSENSITIVE 5-like protein 6 n=1 Tax=Striga hermonthica TaxID=68872 RepID=A0A9N7REZ4_STRHE|nr:ABSCISIC ACID-INSENSITIVE 5-like protein 6 [Striga hermonthica]
MGSYMNSKNLGDASQLDGRTAVNFPLARQSSIYSLTFDEFQNTLGGPGKDFGSMNMEDLLKSIWTAEESQTLQPRSSENLQRQGSLTLPRTLSQKTVDEVWRDVLKETVGVNSGGLTLGQREPTLGGMTLEDFLAKAGVVREEAQLPEKTNGIYLYGAPNENTNNSGLTMGFQQQPLQSNLAVLTGQQVTTAASQPQLQPLFPKQTTLTFSSQSTQIGSNIQLSRSYRAKGPMVGTKNVVNNLYAADGIVKSCADTPSSCSPPLSYNFEEVGRGRRSNSSLEKVVERRRKRMIKNRESAARSRARKQAYTLELEAEVAKLKEMNEELRKKQKEFMEMQKNQILEKMNKPWGEKRVCLRRTLTGPW